MTAEIDLVAGSTPRDALAAVFERDYERLVRAARALVDERGEAEEVVQDALARSYAKWLRSGVPASPSAYVRRAVLNRARSRLGRRIRARLIPGERADAVASPEADSVARSEQRRALTLLRALPVRQRECLVLRFFFDESVADTAATLGISPGSVKTHVHRGLRSLEAAMTDHPEEA